MRTFRNLRVANLIQEELGKIILREIEFGKSVLVTITGVEVSKDLSRATIKLGIFPSAGAKEAMDLIERYRPFLQRLLMKKINIKPMPKIVFSL